MLDTKTATFPYVDLSSYHTAIYDFYLGTTVGTFRNYLWSAVNLLSYVPIGQTKGSLQLFSRVGVENNGKNHSRSKHRPFASA